MRWRCLLLFTLAGCEQLLGISEIGGSPDANSSTDGGVIDAVPTGACGPMPVFAPVVNFGVTGSTGLAVGDMNHDGVRDAVVAIGDDVVAFDGNGGGSFGSSHPLLPTPASVDGVAVADLNDDGFDDLVTWKLPPGSSVSTYLQSSTTQGQFGAAQTFSITIALDPMSEAQPVVVGNLDGDEYPDLVVADATSASVHFSRTSTPGTFDQQPDLDGDGGYLAAVADLDADGLDDVVFGAADGAKIAYNTVGSPGTFSAVVSVGGYSSGGVAVGAYAGNAPRMDLAFFSGKIVVYVHTSPRTFLQGTRIMQLNSGGRPFNAEINGDGLDDIATNGDVTLQCPAPDTGTFSEDEALDSLFQGARARVFVDLDGNGNPDLLQLQQGADFLQVYLQP